MEHLDKTRVTKRDGMPPIPELRVGNRRVEFNLLGVPRSEYEVDLNSLLRSSLPSHPEDALRPMAQPHILRDLLGDGQIKDLLAGISRQQVEPLFRDICGTSDHSRIVILAILILVGRSEMIKDVVWEGISDRDLPFQFDKAAFPYFHHRYDSQQPLDCFNILSTYYRDSVNSLQWSLRTPFMEVKGPAFKPYKNAFDDETVLPWTSIKVEFGEIAPTRGDNTVYRCCMDDRFHGFNGVLREIGLEGGKGEFALKVINPHTVLQKKVIRLPYEDDEEELHYLNGVIHRHLATLLATFTYKTNKDKHFLFPWADSNLFEFWLKEGNPDPHWVSDQLAGLVGALATIHNPSHLNGDFGFQVDMKPDNILWYKPYKGSESGILVISDIGFPVFDGKLSRSKHSFGEPLTPEYGAPEWGISNIQMTSQCNIWSLGCIFLEMMAWMVGGSDFVDDFKRARGTAGFYGIKGRVFFKLAAEGDKVTSPVVKPEVIQWVEKVKSHEKSTQFICDVVEVVMDKMMRPLASERATITTLQSEFEIINKKCQMEGTSYYYKKAHSRRVDTADSAYGSGLTSVIAPTESKSFGNTAKDSGYESASNSLVTQMETQSLAYSNSNVPETTREIYVQNFAARLFDKLSSDISSTESLDRVAEALGENLKGFATRLGLNTKKQTQLDIVLFAHKHGSEIQDAFQTLLDEKKKEQMRVTQEEVAFNTDAWVGTQQRPDVEPPPDSPSIGSSLSILDETQDHHDFDNDIFIDIAFEDMAFGEDMVSNDNDGVMNDMAIENMATLPHSHESSEGEVAFKRFFEYHDIVLETTAYAWLIETLRRDALLRPAAQNHMRMISNEILQHLTIERISRTSPSKVFKVSLILNWDPWDFVQDQEPQKRPEQALLGAITFTGSPYNAQALTCSEYLTQTWPLNGKSLVQLLVNLMKSGPETACNETLADGTEVTAITQGDKTIIRAIGVADAVAEVGQQLAWIGAALRSAPPDSEPGLFLCKSSLTIIKEGNQIFGEDDRTFELKFKMEGPMDFADEVGSCWHNMLRNAVLVTGFPIRAKSAEDPGIEMPLDIMACLSGSYRAIEFDGKIVLKGFSTMLSVVKQVEDFLIWHYTFHSDASRIPFFEAVAPHTYGLHLGLLGTHRHIIGWCSSARYYTGAPEADYDIEESGLPGPANGCILDRVSLSGGKFVSANLSLSLSNKNIPPQLTRHGYADMLRFLDQQFVILWDVKDKRGWLVNGTSALLHLARARMKDIGSGKWSSLYKFDSNNLKEAGEKHHPTLSAAEVLRDDRNRELVVGKGRMESYNGSKSTDTADPSPSTLKKHDQLFEHFVEDDMSYLEQIIDHQLRLGGQNGVRIKTNVRRHLEGWDFMDLVNRSNPSPRMAVLDSLGWGWVDFVRSINAVTLFGRGFGDLIQPSEPELLCHGWQKLPTDRYCLAASATDLMTAMKAHGSRFTDPPQLVHSLYWHSPTSCACEGAHTFNKKHIDPVQVLWPSALKHLRTIKTPTGLDKMETAAFVFGHNVSNAFGRVRWPDAGDKLPEIVEDAQGNLLEAPPMIIASSPESDQVITESFLQHASQHREEQENSQAAYSSTTASYRPGSSMQTDTTSTSSIEPPTPNMMTVPKVLSPDKDPEATIEDRQGSTVGPQQEAREPSETAFQPPITSGPSEKRGVLERLKKNFRSESQSRTTGPRLPITSALGGFGWNLAQRRRHRNYHDSSTG